MPSRKQGWKRCRYCHDKLTAYRICRKFCNTLCKQRWFKAWKGEGPGYE